MPTTRHSTYPETADTNMPPAPGSKEAVSLIDEHLKVLSSKTLVSSLEMTDVLLDIRQLVSNN